MEEDSQIFVPDRIRNTFMLSHNSPALVFRQFDQKKPIGFQQQKKLKHYDQEFCWSFQYQTNEPNQEYQINILKSRSMNVYAYDFALADSLILFIDISKGLTSWAEDILSKAVRLGLRPLVFMDLTKYFDSKQFNFQKIVQSTRNILDKINLIIDSVGLQCQPTVEFKISRINDNIIFGSEEERWAFKLNTQSKEIQGQMEKLYKIRESLNKQDYQIIDTLKIDIKEDLSKQEKFHHVFGRIANISKCIFDMIVKSAPSPKAAQKCRNLQSGQCSLGVRQCDPSAPLILYCSRILNYGDVQYGFGRIFSGTVTPKSIVKFKTQIGKDSDNQIANIYTLNGSELRELTKASAGSLITFTLTRKYFISPVTLFQDNITSSIVNMLVRPCYIIKVSVIPSNPTDLPKFLEKLLKCSRTDISCSFTIQQTGQNFISAEMFEDITNFLSILESLQPQCPIQVSDPQLIYRQTVTQPCSKSYMVKSQNRLNRYYGRAEPLNQMFMDWIDNNPQAEQKQLKQKACEEFQWQLKNSINVLSFGPDNKGPNVFINQSDYKWMYQVEPHMVMAFQRFCKQGALAYQQLRGYLFTLTDVVYYSDAIHRGGGQTIPAMRRLFHGCQLASRPTLMKPFYECELFLPLQIAKKLQENREMVYIEQGTQSKPLTRVQCFVSAEELLAWPLKSEIQSIKFANWRIINSFPENKGSEAAKVLQHIRKVKAFQQKLPNFENYFDRD